MPSVEEFEKIYKPKATVEAFEANYNKSVVGLPELEKREPSLMDFLPEPAATTATPETRQAQLPVMQPTKRERPGFKEATLTQDPLAWLLRGGLGAAEFATLPIRTEMRQKKLEAEGEESPLAAYKEIASGLKQEYAPSAKALVGGKFKEFGQETVKRLERSPQPIFDALMLLGLAGGAAKGIKPRGAAVKPTPEVLGWQRKGEGIVKKPEVRISPEAQAEVGEINILDELFRKGAEKPVKRELPREYKATELPEPLKQIVEQEVAKKPEKMEIKPADQFEAERIGIDGSVVKDNKTGKKYTYDGGWRKSETGEFVRDSKTKAYLDIAASKKEPFWSNLENAFKLWVNNKIYSDKNGHYRWQSGENKGRIIPDNKLIRSTFNIGKIRTGESAKAFHDAAREYTGIPLELPGKYKPSPPPLEAPKPAGREPWEMTKEEIKNNEINFRKSRPDLYKKQSLDIATKRTIDINHREIVQQALSEGKPVPPEVLADYPELAKGAGKIPPKIPKAPIAKPEPIESKTIGLNKVEVDNIRHNTGLAELPEVERHTWQKTLDEAKTAKMDENAITTAKEVIESKRLISDQEHAGMVIKAAQLANEYDGAVADVSRLIKEGDIRSADIARKRAGAIINDLDVLTDATRQGRREVARALSIGRMMVNRESYELAHVIQKAQAAKGQELTSVESAKFEGLVAEHKALQAKVEQIETAFEAISKDREKLIADKIARMETKKVRITEKSQQSRERIVAEREDIKKKINALGYRVNDITGVTPEASYWVGRLAVNYIKEGAVNLETVVKRVLADIPQITERDVYKSLAAKDPKAQARMRSEIIKRVVDFKKQAKLLIDIENAQKGIFEKAQRSAPDTPQEIKSLQRQLKDLRTNTYKTEMDATRLERAIQTINELQDQLENQYRKVRKQKRIEPPDLALAKEKVKTLRQLMKNEDQIAILNEQLRTGEFKIKDPKPPRLTLPELERSQIELRQARKKINAAIEEMAPMTPRKIWGETVNTLRTMKATADMSATLRQGLVLSVTRPILATKAFARSAKAFFSEYSAEQIDYALRGSENQFLRDKSGLYLSPLDMAKVTAREEMFMSRWAERIPIIKHVVKASERHMISELNLLRAGAFDEFLAKYPNATQAELTAWADFVNVASGRGNLGRLAAVGNELSTGFFAPRFAVSRFQTPYKMIQYFKMPRVRKAITKDMAGFAGLGMTTLALAKMAGAEVSIDPRSADFGKIKIGNTRIDIWGGFQQPARLMIRMAVGATDKAGLTAKELTDYQRRIDPLELISRFAAYKLSPAITVPLEFYKGKTIVGEEVTPLETAAKAVMPMVVEDIYDAYRIEGGKAALMTAPATFLGLSAYTYEKKKPAGKSKFKRKLLTRLDQSEKDQFPDIMEVLGLKE